MKPPSRKPRKRSRNYKAPQIDCPMCGTVVFLSHGGNVPLHKDGKDWCQYHGLKPEQYDRLVSEGLLMSKKEQARKAVEAVMNRYGISSPCQICTRSVCCGER